MSAVALQQRDLILERIANGDMLQSVAKAVGIAAPNISKHLADDPEYRKAREIGAELRLHLAYRRMDECAEGETVEDENGERVRVETKGNLARAREAAFRAAAWFAEREFPHRWGNRQHIEVSGHVQLDVILAQMELQAGTTIESGVSLGVSEQSGSDDSK